MTDQPSSKNPDLSIIIPTYNEAESIVKIVHQVIDVMLDSSLDFEVIVVDDGSTDDTPGHLKSLKAKYPERIRIPVHLRNRGNGAAVRTGIRAARGKVLVTMDADGQHSPKDILTLLANVPPYDLVVAARTDEYQGSWYRRAANSIYNRLASWLSGAKILDLTSGFRVMRRDAVLHFLPLLPEGFSAPTTTTLAFLKAGYNVMFVPVEFGVRKSGDSKISLWKDGSRFVLIIIRMIMLYDPLRVFIPTGMALFSLGLLAGIAGAIAAERLVIANSAILLCIAGLLTWLLGFLASLISSSLIRYQGDETIVYLDPKEE